jgi:hypothetical protein
MHQAMRQTLHIFKKDVRYLRYEINLILLIASVFTAMHARASQGLSNDSWWAELALVVAAAFLIGRLVLAEAIPGDRQFWITRPYRWQSLLGAKLLFIAAFVNLPVLLAHLFILIVDGFPLASSLPGLIWSQVLLFAFLSLPFAALATLNSGMAPFIFSQLIVLATGFSIWELLVPTHTARLSGVEWVRDSIALAALEAIAIPVLLVQYKTRRTLFSRCLALGGVAAGALAFVAMPWPLALAVQSHFSKQPSVGSSVQISLSHDPLERFWLASMKPKVALHLPISVQGIPAGTEVQADALTLSVVSADGRATQIGVMDCADLRRGTISASAATISAVCLADPTFFHRYSEQPVTVRASLYFTLFGNARSQIIPLTAEPSNAPDGLQCYTNVVKAEWDVYCRSAFRWPARLVFAKLGHTNANSFAQFVSYSPFPASLNIDPVETRWASAFASGPPPNVRDVTIVVEEPLAHLQRDFEAQGVLLEEFAYPSVRVGPAPIDIIR